MGPLGPLLFSPVLLDLMESIEVPSFQLWYLDDGTFVGSRSAVADLLDFLATQGPSFGLTLNLKKCEVFLAKSRSIFSYISAGG